MGSRRRVTPAMVRRLALALPEAFESSHFNRPDFRVRNRIFATLRKDERTVVLKTTPVNLDALMRADRETFWDEWGSRWVGVRLEGITVSQLRDLLAEAWRLAAPKRLARRLDEQRSQSRD